MFRNFLDMPRAEFRISLPRSRTCQNAPKHISWSFPFSAELQHSLDAPDTFLLGGSNIGATLANAS